MALKKTKTSGKSDAAARIEAAKKKLGDLKNRESSGGEGRKDFHTLVEGKNIVRVLPIQTAMSGDFYIETSTHFNVGPEGKDRFLCPRMHGGKCPLCRQREKLLNELKPLPRGDKKREKMWAEQREMSPRQQYAMLVLVVGPNADLENPKVLQVGPQIFKDILTYYTDADEYGPILDLTEGRDIIIEKEVPTDNKGKPIARETKYKVSLRSEEKSIDVDESVMEAATTNGPDLDKLYGEEAIPSYEAIMAKIEGVEYDEEDEDEEEEDDKEERKRSPRFKQKDEDEEEEDEEESESDEEEEEEEKLRKKKPAPKDEEDEEEEEQEDDEEESESDEEEDEDEKPRKKSGSFRDRLKDKAKR